MTELLTKTQELRLIRKAQGGSSRAMNELLEAFGPLVGRIAKGYPTTAAAGLEDLVQEGLIGLHGAIGDFDTDSGLRLATTARFRISREISRAASNGAAIPVPPSTVDRYTAAWADAATYDEALAAAMSFPVPMNEHTFAAAHAAITGVDSLDRVTSDDEGNETTVGETLAEVIPESGDADLAHAILGSLEGDEREVMAQAHGLATGAPMSDAAIAASLGLSRQKVQRIRTAATTALRERFTA